MAGDWRTYFSPRTTAVYSATLFVDLAGLTLLDPGGLERPPDARLPLFLVPVRILGKWSDQVPRLPSPSKAQFANH